LQKFILAQSADGSKDSTLNWYTSLLGAFIEQNADTAITEIATDELREYINELRERDSRWEGEDREQAGKLSEDTINAHIRALHKFWGWLADEYDISNPMKRIKYPKKPEAKPKAIPLADVLKLWAATGDDLIGVRNRALLAFLLDTGCRAAGLLGLKPEDVELEQHRATVTEKGSRTRLIYFTEFTAGILAEWMSQRVQARTVFYNFETLRPLTASGLRGILKRLAKRAGVVEHVHPHAFRHAFANGYLRSGGNLATLSKLMGHRDVKTTIDHYIHFTQDDLGEQGEQFSPAHRLQKKNAPEDSEASD